MLKRIMFVGLVLVQCVYMWEVEREAAFPSAEARERERERKRGWGLHLKLLERVYNVVYILN